MTMHTAAVKMEKLMYMYTVQMSVVLSIVFMNDVHVDLCMLCVNVNVPIYSICAGTQYSILTQAYM